MFQEMKVNWATSPGNQPKQDTSSEYAQFLDFRLHMKNIFSTMRFAFELLYLLDLLDSHTNWSEQRITVKENFLKLFHRKVKCILELLKYILCKNIK